MKRYFLFALFLLFNSSFVTAQSQSAKSMMVMNMDKVETYKQLLKFAQENDYFITSLNPEVGFQQWKYISKGKGILARERRLYINLFLHSEKTNEQRIDFQINLETQQSTNDVGDFRKTFKDEGVVHETAYYDGLIRLLKTYFDRIQTE